MVQQTTDSKFSEYGLGNNETNLSTRDKQFPVPAKKTVLRDVQNESRIHNSVGNSPLSKDRGQTMNDIKVSGKKRSSPEVPVSPPAPVPRIQSASSNAANAHLVYVRRKSEAEIGKTSTCDVRSSSADCLNSRQLGHSEETTQLNTQIKEPKVCSFPALAPMPAASLISASGKPSVPLVQSTTRFASAESNYHPVASTLPSSNNPKGKKNLHWEERYRQLQILLKKLDESDQEEYVQGMSFFLNRPS